MYKTKVFEHVTKDFMKDKLPDILNNLGGKIITVQLTAKRELLVIYEVD